MNPKLALSNKFLPTITLPFLAPLPSAWVWMQTLTPRLSASQTLLFLPTHASDPSTVPF